MFMVRLNIQTMLRDRGDQLKYALVSALARAAKVVRGLRIGLTVGEREAVAEAAVDQLRKAPADPWKLAEPIPARFRRHVQLGGADYPPLVRAEAGSGITVMGTNVAYAAPPQLCHLYERDILGG